MKRVAIIGGGFAGVVVARDLSRRLPPPWEVVIYNQENHFVFKPLLAEVIGISLNPLHVVWPIRQMAPRARHRIVSVAGLDFHASQVIYRDPEGEYVRETYDHLVLATGSVAPLGLVPGMAAHAFPLRSLGDAIVLRNQLIHQLEQADLEQAPARQAELCSFAVVGAGFTGIEIAGAVVDLVHALPRTYRNVDPSHVRVTVIDSGDRILRELPDSLSAYAQRTLERHGIQFRLGVRVQEVTAHGVVLRGGERIPASLVVSAVGNVVPRLIERSGLPLVRGRIRTEPDMRVTGRANVWALGDCAAVPNGAEGETSPMLGQFAVRQARLLVKNLVADIEGRPTQPFRYRSLGTFAAIGGRSAVGNPFGILISGFLAWLLWHAIYWWEMPSLARKVEIAFDWLWTLLFPRDLVSLSVEPSALEGDHVLLEPPELTAPPEPQLQAP
ncbi:MAG TPA: NAD(P)/FAD-dependent oxidoreductase [Polyangia bacterium]|nr:NAD(P)/FAD-dependent oxidoreductase [Polyangia bacterium]